MKVTGQPWRCGRAIVMIALAYLFVLQGLLAPVASLAGGQGAVAAAMPLCDVAEMAGPRQDGGPAGDHDHRACCDLGCLPQKGGLSVVAVPPPSGTSLPALRPAGVAMFRPATRAGIAATVSPGLPGARAPPLPFA